MERHGEEYWRKKMEEHRGSGLSAAAFCRKGSLKRGTFLRWRKRLRTTTEGRGFVEVSNSTSTAGSRDPSRSLEVHLGEDIRITVHPDSDLDFVGKVIAAIRRAS